MFFSFFLQTSLIKFCAVGPRAAGAGGPSGTGEILTEEPDSAFGNGRVGSLSVVASRRVRRRRRPKSGPILREWSAKNTTLAWIFQSPTSILARTRLKSVNFAPAAGRLTKNLLRPLRFSIFGGRWRPARQVVFLPPKSGIYHLSVPQPPARSVPRDRHTGKLQTL